MSVAAVPRIFSASVLSFLVTLSLFYLMITLIDSGELELDESTGFIVEFVKSREMEELTTKRPRPEKPEPPEEMPSAPDVVIPGEKLTSLYEGPPAVETPDVWTPAGGLSDGAYLPIVKVQPAYPRRALERGIEGYTVVEFDVAPDGSVRRPRIIVSEPARVFDQASLKAVKRFRYKPMVENGVAVTVTGVQNRFTFEIQK